MPGTTTSGSANIALLDSKLIVDLCQGKFFVDITPSVWIAAGYESVLGANVKIVNPAGVIVKPYGSNYEIAPGLTGEMDAVISFNVPTVGGNYMYGTYTVFVQLFDEGGASWIVEKSVTICEPDANYKTRNYGSLSAILKGVCKDGKLFVIVDGVPNYKGKQVTSQVNAFTLTYPTSSGLAVLSTTQGNFTVVLYEGVYKFVGTICALYDFGDNVFVKINYKVKREHDVKCIIDECCFYQQIAALQTTLDSDCSEDEKGHTRAKILQALNYKSLIELAANCGEDPSEFVTSLEDLLGCACTCNCNEGTPIIDATPSGDVVVTGCNVSVVTAGLTKTYTINNYSYVVNVADNGGALTMSAQTLDGCAQTQVLTFNISVVYSQIKSLINNNTEYNTWAEFISNTWDDLDITCLNVTAGEWALMTYKQRTQAIIDFICGGGGSNCSALVENVLVETNGNSQDFTWSEENDPHHVEIYINDVLVGTVLGGTQTFSYVPVVADAQILNYKIIPYCKSGVGTGVTGTITVQRGTFVAPPEVYSPYLQGVVPYDLTTNLLPLPLGVTAEWHTANNTLASSLVADPSNANPGAYFVFAKDSDNFYSTGVQVTLVVDITGSCTAPQNLTVVSTFGGNLIQFKSAAYPPPLNSYTVKRRLKDDPDVAGSYTTIGTPVWNASASRWVIVDATAVNNVLYVYRAVSNCSATAPYIDVDYASISCPTLTLTQHASEIGYSFVPVGGGVTKYEITIYSDNGVTAVHTDTKLPAFANPVTGSFADYLDADTHYWVGIKIFIGTYSKTCPLQQTDTYPDTATLTIDYVAGTWSGVLTSPVSEDLVITTGSTQALGSNDDCVTPFQTDTMPTMTLEAHDLSVEDGGGGVVDYLSEKYKITNIVLIKDSSATILYEAVSGGTFVLDGVTITVVINHLVCGYYPA